MKIHNPELLRRNALAYRRQGHGVRRIAVSLWKFRDNYGTDLSLDSLSAVVRKMVLEAPATPEPEPEPIVSAGAGTGEGTIQPSPQQEAAIKRAKQWLENKSGPQVFRLFGYAGTGKTTLAKLLVEDVKGKVLYAAFTGKAALVLRNKGCRNASTIHSLIYTAVENPETRSPTYVLNPQSPVAGAALVVVDEVSMVGNDLAGDLLSFGTKVLVLGDPAQLPPVEGEGYFINGNPDVMLTEVHRQAEHNPIIRLSMDIRAGRKLIPGSYGDSVIVRRGSISRDDLRDMVMAADQLLCGRNKTRCRFNARIREIRGLGGAGNPSHPVPGDRLICLRNNREKQIFNGELWEVTMSHADDGPGKFIDLALASLDDPCRPLLEVRTPEAFFSGTDDTLDRDIRRQSDEFTFGWAITCHKAQGSQWDHPIVFDESSCFRKQAAKWLYTAITRAAKRVSVVVP